MVNFISIP